MVGIFSTFLSKNKNKGKITPSVILLSTFWGNPFPVILPFLNWFMCPRIFGWPLFSLLLFLSKSPSSCRNHLNDGLYLPFPSHSSPALLAREEKEPPWDASEKESFGFACLSLWIFYTWFNFVEAKIQRLIGLPVPWPVHPEPVALQPSYHVPA